MKTATLFFVLACGVFLTHSARQDDYLQWIDVDEDIPENAIPAGNDNNNKTVYVARVFKNHTSGNFERSAIGWLPAGITAGQTSVDVVLHEKIYTVTEGIQILTTVNNSVFKWIDVSYISFPRLFDTEDKHPVRSGWEFDGLEFNATVYIGKCNNGKTVVIGKIFEGAIMYANNNVLYFPNSNNSVGTVQEYSALVYYY